MAAGFNNCQITEAIQNLPPELREIIYKHYLERARGFGLEPGSR